MGIEGTPVLAEEEVGAAETSAAVGKSSKDTLLLGRDPRTLDERGRLSLPTKYRWAFPEGAVVLPWPGPCIVVMPVERFLKIEQKMRDKQRDRLGDSLARDALTELATHTKMDAQGRLFIDAALREEAEIEHDLDLLGRVRHLELWKPASRDASRKERIQALQAHIAAEAL